MSTPETQPHNIDAERSVLGAVLVQNEALDRVSDVLRPDMFYRPGHALVFAAMLRLWQADSAIDSVTLKAELSRVGRLDDAGGLAYVVGLSDGVPRSTNITHYANLVRQAAARRSVIRVANQLLDAAYRGEVDAAGLIDQAEQGLLAVSQENMRQVDTLQTAREIADTYWPVLEQIVERRRPLTGALTGLATLDAHLLGLQPGHLVILGGRPGGGKSSIALQLAVHVAQHTPGHVLFFSIEMSNQDQFFRLLAHLSPVDGHLLQSGHLPPHIVRKVADTLPALQQLRLSIDQHEAPALPYIRSRARRVKAQHGLSLIVVDYLQIMRHDRAETREQQIAATTRGLKSLGRQLDVPVLALSQLSRTADGQRPTLASLRESGSIEQEANVVLLAHRPDVAPGEAPKPMELIIAKNRSGPKTTVFLDWREDEYRFDEMRPEADGSQQWLPAAE